MGATCGGSWTIRSCHVDRIVGTVGTVDTKKEHDPGESAYHFRFQLTFPSRIIGRKRFVFFSHLSLAEWPGVDGWTHRVHGFHLMVITGWWCTSVSAFQVPSCAVQDLSQNQSDNHLEIGQLTIRSDWNPTKSLFKSHFPLFKVGLPEGKDPKHASTGPWLVAPLELRFPNFGQPLGGARNMPMTPENYPVGSLDSDKHPLCHKGFDSDGALDFLWCWWTFWDGTQNDWWRIMAVCSSIRTGSRWTTMKLYETSG